MHFIFLIGLEEGRGGGGGQRGRGGCYRDHTWPIELKIFIISSFIEKVCQFLFHSDHNSHYETK